MEVLAKSRRAYLSACLPAFAALLCAARYWQQGASGVWSKRSLHVYVPDPDLGWRHLEDGIPWLGLDSIFLMCALAVVVLGGAHMLRGRAAWTRMGLWALAAPTLLVPTWAFVAGAPPAGARATLPGEQGLARLSGISAHLSSAPAGQYRVLPHKDAAIAVGLVAGGEAFDARWAGGLEGGVHLDPATLTTAIDARFAVQSASVRTDLDDRDAHIRDYLEAETHPAIAVELVALRGTQAQGSGAIRFDADGQLLLMGGRVPVSIAGTLSVATPEQRTRLGLEGAAVILLQARFTLDLRKTPIEDPQDLFDDYQSTVNVTLFLQHEE